LEHSDSVKGSILLIQAPGTPTLVKGTITGLTPGEHGFHIHEFGDMSKGCESMGGHYNPDGVDHGHLGDGHVGDLGNITANDKGTASFSIRADRVDLIGDRSVVGRGIVVHADQDDLGKGGDEESIKTGNAGDRLACGVITLRAAE
jgi:Cu-Zn family superoxide dismutase